MPVVFVTTSLGVFYGFGLKKNMGFKNSEIVYVKKGALRNSLSLIGAVRPRSRIELRLALAGRVDQVLFQEGDEVKKGQTLIWYSSMERAALMDSASSGDQEQIADWESYYRPIPLIAPIDGTIIQRNTEPGQAFSSTDAVAVMADRLIVAASVDETDLSKVKVGMKSTIRLDAYLDTVFEATVRRIAFDGKTENNVTTYEIELVPESPPHFVKSGMTAEVKIWLDEIENVVVLPAKSIRFDDKSQPYVFVVENPREGVPAKREVELGLSDGYSYEIKDGVPVGAAVLVPRVDISEREGPNGFMVDGFFGRKRNSDK